MSSSIGSSPVTSLIVVAITTTLFLAAVTFKTYMSTLLPALPYLTSVEWFLLGGMLLLLIQGLLIARVGWFCVNSEEY